MESTEGEKLVSDIEELLIHPRKLKHLLYLALFLFLGYLSHIGLISNLLHLVLNEHVLTVDRNYLSEAQKTSEKTMTVLSGIKSTLALIQSSQGGISFIVDVNVQLGQVFSGISELVTMSWKISLASILSIRLQGYLLDLSVISMAPLFTLFFVLVGASLSLSRVFPRIGGFFSEISLTGLLLVFVVHFLWPLTIYVTASASNYYFSEISSAVHQGYEEIDKSLSQHNPKDSLHNQVKTTIKTFNNGQQDLSESATKYSRSMVFHTIFSILEFVVMPLAVFILMVTVTRRVLSRIWEGSTLLQTLNHVNSK